ncbi:uncharacterized protein LOC144178202 isoform X2 [Haemaphysalis longicornis]
MVAAENSQHDDTACVADTACIADNAPAASEAPRHIARRLAWVEDLEKSKFGTWDTFSARRD